MGQLTIYLPVYSGPMFHGEFRLYEKAVDTPFLPRPGDRFEVSEDVDGEVKRPFWRPDGSVGLELIGYHIDPSDNLASAYSRPYGQEGLPAAKPWWTESDRDLEELLLASGWAAR